LSIPHPTIFKCFPARSLFISAAIYARRVLKFPPQLAGLCFTPGRHQRRRERWTVELVSVHVAARLRVGWKAIESDAVLLPAVRVNRLRREFTGSGSTNSCILTAPQKRDSFTRREPLTLAFASHVSAFILHGFRGRRSHPQPAARARHLGR
jgi:hypothetical protein